MNSTASPLKSRRKPVQQRSKMTQTAILEAFVRLLVEKGYVSLTIRDIALVAGVGLGTVYEYFPGKKSIAAHCIQQRFKGVGTQMLACIEAKRGCPLPEMVAEILDGMLEMHAQNVEEWSALIFLERQISDPVAYHVLYQHIVDIWSRAFDASSDGRQYAGKSPDVVHAAVYGLLYQRLMTAPKAVRENEFRQQLKSLVLGYLLA
ncbi:TetR/AcrR family transcriptional regulator [Undibacterium sp.]|jgi:AcrR family transcriptional regulator|uniref:TetR/AcrR family transcriptional regulator n=1 Tax=Undibacterium sp. TaxID=1914977 RepID=UPI002C6CDD1C|nr:TetR/AcrR family transcriptional regulator [Undibacterium sp.]HTD05122.1 TetR/AcrR family transcriptional regulator [Undibacterium sp.]